MKLTPAQIKVIKKEMAGMAGKAASMQAQILSKQFDVTSDRIYHYSRDVRPRRNSRSDKGALKCDATPADLEKLAWLSVRKDYSGPHLADIHAANNGGVYVSAATINRYLRRQNISRNILKKGRRPYISWQAKYPNQLHQLDSTVAQQFYLNDDGTIGFESPTQRYKNKPGNKKPRLHLIALVDDFSRVTFAQFALGNHTYAWLSFLHAAWSIKNDDVSGFPFYGLPKILYTDNDSVVKSKKFQRAMRLLDIEVRTHEVENPQAKGKVEAVIRYLQEFEKTRIFDGWKTLAEANRALFDYLYHVNGKHHSVTEQMPFSRWQLIKSEQLRLPPNDEMFRYLHMDSVLRKIKPDMTVSINGVIWQLPIREPFLSAMHRGEPVEIYWHPHEEELIYIVIDDKEHPVEYLEKQMRAIGRYQSVEMPAGLIKRDQLAEQDEPDLKQEHIYKDLYRKNWLPKHGQEFDESQFEQEFATGGVQRTKLWFKQQLQREYLIPSPPTEKQIAWIDSVFGDQRELPETELLKLIQQLQEDDSQLNDKKQALG